MRWLCASLLILVPSLGFAAQGNAVSGRENFRKFHCDTCHSVWGEKRTAAVPLPDFSRRSENEIAETIAAHTQLSPEALFDEMAMAAATSYMTPQQLMDIAAFLRNPSAEAPRPKKNR